MDLIKYIAIRIVACIAFVVLGNVLYQFTFYEDDISLHGDILENLWAIDDDSEAIYFGESSNFHITKQETVHHRISHILDELVPELKIATVDNSGLHAGTFLALIKNIEPDSDVKLLIITMNLRSFGANWRCGRMENYLAKTELMLSPNLPILNKFMVSLRNYDHRTDDERRTQYKRAWKDETFTIPDFEYSNVTKWDSAMAWGTWVKDNPYLSKKEIPLACHFIKNFAFEIVPLTNQRIADFDEIMEIANDKGYKIILNLLDENMEELQNLVGDNLRYLVDKNRKFLIDRYEKKGAIVVDNFYTIPNSYFVDRGWPTEHYSKPGKTIIAKNIAKAIRDNHLISEASATKRD